MLDGVFLLARENKAAARAARDSRRQGRWPDAVLAPLRHHVRRPLQPSFDVEHFAAGEARPARAIATEAYELRRGPQCAHHPVELILAVAVAVAKTRQVMVGEGRLLMGDRRQGHRGLGDDPCAIAPGDIAVVLGAIRAFAAIKAPNAGRADLVLGLELDALVREGSMIDPRLKAQLRQPRVDVVGPRLAPMRQQFGAIPVPRLGAEPKIAAFAFDQFAQGEHDMGVRLGAAVLGDVPMHVEVGDHAAIDELPLHVIPGQRDALRLVHLTGQGKLDLARQLRVLALLAGLDRVPQRRAILPGLRRALRRQDLRVDDAALVCEVVSPIEPLVVQSGRRAIGRRGHSAGAVGAADDLCREVIDRHRRRSSSLDPSARRHDV